MITLFFTVGAKDKLLQLKVKQTWYLNVSLNKSQKRNKHNRLTSSLTGTSERLDRLKSISFPLSLSFRFNALLVLLILKPAGGKKKSHSRYSTAINTYKRKRTSENCCKHHKTPLILHFTWLSPDTEYI